MSEGSAESTPEPSKRAEGSLEAGAQEPKPSSPPEPLPSTLYVPTRELERDASGNLPAYQVAARMLLQGVLSGFAGAVPLTLFVLVAMVLDGVNPGQAQVFVFVAGYLFSGTMLTAWGAALTAIEEFARRADRSPRRMIAASLGFPLFAALVTGWIAGVAEGGPRKGLQLVRSLAKDLWREFQREPGSSLAMTAALLIPFLGLLLVRRREEEREAPRYYLSSAGLGLASATSVLVATQFLGARVKASFVLLGFTSLASLLLAVSWGLARGRAVADRYCRRYQRWADVG